MKKETGFSKVIVTIILAVVVVIVGCLYFFSDGTSFIGSSKNSLSQGPDIYRNEKYGFEFTMPGGWTIKESSRMEEGVITSLTFTDGTREVYLQTLCLTNDSHFMTDDLATADSREAREISISGQKFYYYNRLKYPGELEDMSFSLAMLKKASGNYGYTNCGIRLYSWSYPTILSENFIKSISTLKFDGGFDAFVDRVVKEFEIAKPFNG